MAAAVEVSSVGKLTVNYSEMLEADQLYAVETASNALRTQEKSETALYHKDVAEIIKKDFDTNKG